MRLSKGQLKRIIREEYSRLKRRGLIKESVGQPNDRLVMDVIDTVDSHYYDGGEKGWVTNTLGYLFEEDIEEVTAMMDEEGEPDDSNLHVKELFRMYDDPETVVRALISLSTENGKPADSIEFLLNKFLKFAQDELGYAAGRM